MSFLNQAHPHASDSFPHKLRQPVYENTQFPRGVEQSGLGSIHSAMAAPLGTRLLTEGAAMTEQSSYSPANCVIYRPTPSCQTSDSVVANLEKCRDRLTFIEQLIGPVLKVVSCQICDTHGVINGASNVGRSGRIIGRVFP